MGLSALALESNPVFPTYPERISAKDVTAGLVLPDAAVALLGKGGAGATLLLVFMAVTSASSAELIAVSSITTYDIYQTYINPKATGKNLISVSHAACIVYSIILASFSTGLYYAGIGMGYLYLMMGCIISSAVIPASLTLLWGQQNWVAAALSPPLGLICALIGWLVQAKQECGSLSVDCTGSDYPMLVGNVVALLSPIIFIPLLTYTCGPQNYDWQSMLAIRKGDDSDLAAAAHVDLELIPGETSRSQDMIAKEQHQLSRAAVISRSMTLFLTFALIILWPWPMYGSNYIFSKPFFTGWIVVGIIWLFCSLICVGVYPIYESRATIIHTVKSMFLDMRGKYHPKKWDHHDHHHEDVVVEGKEDNAKGENTPQSLVGEKEKEKE